MYGLSKDILKDPDISQMYETFHSFNPALAFYVVSELEIEEYKQVRAIPAVKMIQDLVRSYIARKKKLNSKKEQKQVEKVVNETLK